MSKCGVIAQGPDGQPKVKLYRNEDGSLKGDGMGVLLKYLLFHTLRAHAAVYKCIVDAPRTRNYLSGQISLITAGVNRTPAMP